jgi:predicted ATP-dependent endonuclease of OLD family
MNLHIPSNKIYADAQDIQIDGPVLTLIGENGCGKSAILESLFQSFLEDDTKSVVCFSSGQNESFSVKYNEYLSISQRRLVQQGLNRGENPLRVPSFYFDPQWTRILIFFATTMVKDGKVQRFLREHEYVQVDNDGRDVSTRLQFSLKVPVRYTRRIQNALAREALKPGYNSIRKTLMHQYLENLLAILEPEYSFQEQGLGKGDYELREGIVAEVFARDIGGLFTFLWYTTLKNQFIDLASTQLTFSTGWELNDLSDGEYQLLTIFAILDLFDGPETLFILDEIDSHLYYKNVNAMWQAIKNVEGKVLSTTHSADSILAHTFDQNPLSEQWPITTTNARRCFTPTFRELVC